MKDKEIKIATILKVAQLEIMELSKEYYKDKYTTTEYFQKCDNVMNVTRLKIEMCMESEEGNESNKIRKGRSADLQILC